MCEALLTNHAELGKPNNILCRSNAVLKSGSTHIHTHACARVHTHTHTCAHPHRMPLVASATNHAINLT